MLNYNNLKHSTYREIIKTILLSRLKCWLVQPEWVLAITKKMVLKGKTWHTEFLLALAHMSWGGGGEAQSFENFLINVFEISGTFQFFKKTNLNLFHPKSFQNPRPTPSGKRVTQAEERERREKNAINSGHLVSCSLCKPLGPTASNKPIWCKDQLKTFYKKLAVCMFWASVSMSLLNCPQVICFFIAFAWDYSSYKADGVVG